MKFFNTNIICIVLTCNNLSYQLLKGQELYISRPFEVLMVLKLITLAFNLNYL